MPETGSRSDVEFFFDPVCPFCWVTSEWVRAVQRQRGLRVDWRFISLALLNEGPGAYEGKPAHYPEAHHRGLQMLRVAAAARHHHGREPMGALYQALGQAVWHATPPVEPELEALLAHTSTAGDLGAILESVGLPPDLAAAADDDAWDAEIRAETDEALQRTGGDVGTPIVSFRPPDGPAFFGPVLGEAPPDDEAVRLWEAVETLAHWPTFAELKRGLRTFPDTPVTAKLAGSQTQAA